MCRWKALWVLVPFTLSALTGTVLPAPVAGACALDGVPSLRADSTGAVLNTASRTRQNSAHWAEFVFPRRFSPGETIRFSEDLRELARTLPPEIVHGHWIWQWGDGEHAEGHVLLHRYSRAGAYVIAVAVAVPGRAAFLFDAALVQVGR